LKILILKPSSLGDVVQALPVLRLLKRQFPHSEAFWWIDTNLASLLENDPDLTGVVRFERRRWASPEHWPEMWHSVRWLRAQRFDWVIDLQCLARSGVFAWLANGKLLLGLDEPREGARGFYDLVVPRGSFHTHAVDWYLAVLPRLGVPVNGDFRWLPEQPKIAAVVKARWKPEGTRWIALHPGARWTNKRWPAESFAELVREIAGRYANLRFAILGAEGDQQLGEVISRAAPGRCLNLAGETTLPEMIEWLRICELMVTNDSGPMHVAVALGKPVVALFGPTEPRRTGPYGRLGAAIQHPLPCAPCLKSRCVWPKPMECLTGISPVKVFERVQRELDRSEGRANGWKPGVGNDC